MFIENEDLKKLQALETSMLKDFDAICKKLGITYFIDGGTCLGAVRHKGFIPWDDDIDIRMAYSDYCKLLALFKAEEFPKYSLETHEKNPNLLLPYAKFVLNKSAMVEEGTSGMHINHGIWLDIFPVVHFPISRLKRKHYDFWCKVFFARTIPSYRPNRRLRFKDLIALVVSGFRGPGKCIDKILKMMKKCDEKYKNSPYVTMFARGCLTYPKSIIGNGHYVPFETIEAFCADDFDGYLSTIYGDYMKMPPEDKRHPHHSVDYLSFDSMYEDFLKEKNS